MLASTALKHNKHDKPAQQVISLIMRDFAMRQTLEANVMLKYFEVWKSFLDVCTSLQNLLRLVVVIWLIDC